MYYKNRKAIIPMVILLIASQFVLVNAATWLQAKKGTKPVKAAPKPAQKPAAKQTTAPKSTTPALKTSNNATKSEASGNVTKETIDVTAPDALERIRAMTLPSD